MSAYSLICAGKYFIQPLPIFQTLIAAPFLTFVSLVVIQPTGGTHTKLATFSGTSAQLICITFSYSYCYA